MRPSFLILTNFAVKFYALRSADWSGSSSIVAVAGPHYTKAQCHDPLGYVVLGITYSRKKTIENKLHNKTSFLTPLLSKMIRSRRLAKRFHTDYEAIGEVLGNNVAKNLVDVLRDFVFFTAQQEMMKSKQMQKKNVGGVLVQLKMCGFSDEVAFMRCRVVGDDPFFGRGKWGDPVAIDLWLNAMRIESFKVKVEKKVLDTIVNGLPGMVIGGLLKQGVGDPNVCVFGGRLEENGEYKYDEFFQKLADCAQVGPSEAPVLPGNGACDPSAFLEIATGSGACGGRLLRSGSRIIGGLFSCQVDCFAIHECKYISFWRSGILQWCELHEECNLDNLTQASGTVSVFEKVVIEGKPQQIEPSGSLQVEKKGRPIKEQERRVHIGNRTIVLLWLCLRAIPLALLVCCFRCCCCACKALSRGAEY